MPQVKDPTRDALSTLRNTQPVSAIHCAQKQEISDEMWLILGSWRVWTQNAWLQKLLEKLLEKAHLWHQLRKQTQIQQLACFGISDFLTVMNAVWTHLLKNCAFKINGVIMEERGLRQREKGRGSPVDRLEVLMFAELQLREEVNTDFCRENNRIITKIKINCHIINSGTLESIDVRCQRLLKFSLLMWQTFNLCFQ